MGIKKDFYLEHQRLRDCANRYVHETPQGITEQEIEGLCAQLLERYQKHEDLTSRVLSQKRIRSFRRIAKQTVSMARELLVDVSIRAEQDCLGYIELTGETIILDASCSAAVRQDFASLFREASQTWIDGSEGVCKLRFIFQLYEEEKRRH